MTIYTITFNCLQVQRNYCELLLRGFEFQINKNRLGYLAFVKPSNTPIFVLAPEFRVGSK